jgi:crotonobetainyl-CoA:carnitine CoA-transferase CaiB-like acyl-CoA transferase
VLLDVRDAADRERMDALVRDAHVLVQGYRPGALQQLGYGPDDVARRSPGIVYVSLSAFGAQGPWSERRGFDSLVQTATGFNLAEAEAAGDAARPRALPMQILDEATGFLIAFGAAAALRRQQREGGSWHVQLSLAQTGQWLRGLRRVRDGFAIEAPAREPFLETTHTAWGLLRSVRHSAQLGRTAAGARRPSERPGDSPPRW